MRGDRQVIRILEGEYKSSGIDLVISHDVEGTLVSVKRSKEPTLSWRFSEDGVYLRKEASTSTSFTVTTATAYLTCPHIRPEYSEVVIHRPSQGEFSFGWISCPICCNFVPTDRIVRLMDASLVSKILKQCLVVIAGVDQ